MLARIQQGLLFPGSFEKNKTSAYSNLPFGAKLKYLKTSDLEKVAILHGQALASDGKPISKPKECPHLIFFYGNAMTSVDATWEFKFFRSMECNVWIPDYIGYGESSGIASEKGCFVTADTIYNYLINKEKISPNKIIVAGWSLGAAVAIDLVSRLPAAGLIALSPFTSINDMGHRILPRFIPIAKILNSHFDNLAKIVRVSCPIIIGHGTDDQIIPFYMGEKLMEVARRNNRATEVRFFPVKFASHNTILTTGDLQLIEGIQNLIKDTSKNKKAS